MKEDLRVQKTKAALFRAFYELLAEKNFDDITVNELCDRATVRRATFYKHYRDKQDFLVSIVKKFRADFDEIFWKKGKPQLTTDYFIQYCDTLISYLDVRSGLIENILKGQMRAPFVNVMIHQNHIDTLERLNEAVANGVELLVSVESAASMLTGGIFFVIMNWFESGKRISADQLRADCARMISVVLASEKV